MGDETEQGGGRRRVLLKLSGEAMQGDGPGGVDAQTVLRLAREIREAVVGGVEVAVVVGGGNFWRGQPAAELGMDRPTADQVGMLATVMNALVLQDALESCGQETRVCSSIRVDEVAEPFILRRVLRHLERGRVVVVAAGTGRPFFTTDTAATLRAIEIQAEVVLKATQVDGVYTADPKTDPTAERLASVTHQEALDRGLKVMDVTAISLAMENGIPIGVFDLATLGNITRALLGEKIGSIVESPAS
ncbi:MAG: UMP kinase [Acidobacteriota bacterium]